MIAHLSIELRNLSQSEPVQLLEILDFYRRQLQTSELWPNVSQRTAEGVRVINLPVTLAPIGWDLVQTKRARSEAAISPVTTREAAWRVRHTESTAREQKTVLTLTFTGSVMGAAQLVVSTGLLRLTDVVGNKRQKCWVCSNSWVILWR